MGKSSIESGIPIPPDKGIDEGLELLLPELNLLKVGDSFVISRAKFPLHVVIAMWGIRNNRRHEVRQIEGGDYRVWRTE